MGDSLSHLDDLLNSLKGTSEEIFYSSSLACLFENNENII